MAVKIKEKVGRTFFKERENKASKLKSGSELHENVDLMD